MTSISESGKEVMPLGDYGIKPSDLLAGFFGALSHVLITRPAHPLQGVGAVVVGTVTANYLAADIARVAGLSDGAAGFVAGLVAMVLCRRAIDAATHWRLPWRGTGGGSGSAR